MFDNREAQAGSAVFSYFAPYRSDKSAQKFCPDAPAESRIPYPQQRFSPILFWHFPCVSRPDKNRGACRAIGNRIAEQIDHRFFQQGWVVDSLEVGRAMEFQADLFFLSLEFAGL